MAEHYSPGDLEVIRTARKIWEKDPETEKISYAKLLAHVKEEQPTWALSEKRFKSILKAANLQQTSQPLFTYVKETKSHISPFLGLPQPLRVQNTKSRGIGLYTSQPVAQGKLLWEEEPMVLAVSVEFLRLMRSGSKCAYCAKSLRLTPEGDLVQGAGVACTYCTANWCSPQCKRDDLLHIDTFHAVQRTHRPKISINIWKEYERFCMSNNWKAGYLYGRVLLYLLKSSDKFVENVRAMATVRQETRQKAVATASLELDQLEAMWKRGHAMLAAAVKPLYVLSYEEYMNGIGMVNINNIHGSLFLIQSHLNHNCDPNVSVSFSENPADGITVTAKTNLTAGQELTTSYVNPFLGVEERQYQLRTNWGFICTCAKCKDDLLALSESRTMPKPALKSIVKEPEAIIEALETLSIAKERSSTTSSSSAHRARSKSVHFDKNPVSREIPASS